VRYDNEAFYDREIVTDGNQYESCLFVNCTLVFDGGKCRIAYPTFQGSVTFAPTGAAARTIEFLKVLKCLPGGPALVEAILNRGSDFPDAAPVRTS
jgi:hypothetical protein